MKATRNAKGSGEKAPAGPPADPLPEGVGPLLGYQAAERFVFVAVQGILTIYLVAHLKSATGAAHHLTDAQARTAYHLFLAVALVLPLAGAVAVELLLGKYRTIFYLSLAYCAGLALMVWSSLGLGPALLEPRVWLALGLVLVAVGAGGVQTTVREQVADQFGEEKQHLLAKVRHWSEMAVYLAAALSFLLVPWLLEQWGARAAFGLPAVLIVVATFVFWRSRRKYVRIAPTGFQQLQAEVRGPEAVKALKKLLPLLLVFLPAFWCVFCQTGSAWVLQATRMDRRLLGVEWFESQVQAAGPLLLVVLVPLFTFGIYPLVGKFVKLSAVHKITTGLVLGVAAFGISAWIEYQFAGADVVDCTSQADRLEWRADHLIDGDFENSSWVSDVDPRVRERGDGSAALFPQTIVLELRDGRSWTLEGLRIHPAHNLGRFLMRKRDEVDAATARRLGETEVDTCHPKRIQISVADVPNPVRGWRRVGTITLPRSIEVHETQFRPIEANYVKLEILENRGGPFVGLAEVEILAQGEPPEVGSKELTAAWPNVALRGPRPSIAWQVLAYVLLTLAEVLVALVALELVAASSPPALKSLLVGVFFLGASVGNLFTAAVNSFIQNDDGTSKLSGSGYYWFFAAVLLVFTALYVAWSRFAREPAVAASGEGDEAGSDARQ